MVFFTAEIGINHNGDLEIAKKLINVAVEAGCDAVKFQKRTVEKVYSKEVLDTPRESPWGKTTREQKLGLEFGKHDYDDIDQKVKRFGILLVLGAMACTGFGVVFLKTVLNRINENGMDIKLNLWITAFRLIPGVILSWIIFLFQKNKKSSLAPLKNKQNFNTLIIASILGPFLALGFWILGYAFIAKPSVVSIITQTSVVFIVLLSWLFLKEKLTRLRILSTFFVFIGVILATINF